MADEPTLYDLVLLLSNDAPEEQRARILSAVESAITGAGGSVERNDDWGRRPMAYEIRHQPEAEYHLLQFHAPPSLIEEFSHTLHITDGVLRFRIIKVRRGTPPVKAGAPPVVSAVAAGSGFASEAPRRSAPTGEEEAEEAVPAEVAVSDVAASEPGDSAVSDRDYEASE